MMLYKRVYKGYYTRVYIEDIEYAVELAINSSDYSFA